jgi:hypothetical protein
MFTLNSQQFSLWQSHSNFAAIQASCANMVREPGQGSTNSKIDYIRPANAFLGKDNM